MTEPEIFNIMGRNADCVDEATQVQLEQLYVVEQRVG
jgi:hypothetical protein